jgi:AcrR family transcriptional regulator
MAGDGSKPTDGRVIRGAQNHARIVQALYALVRDGNVQPTAEQVAQRAGVGTRTVFRQFDDFETLYRSLGERVQAEVMAMADLTPPTGRLADDLRALVARRARVFEHMTPFRRAGRLVRHTSAFLQEQDATLARTLREALAASVEPHLGPGAADTIEALDVLLSFEAWDRLRDEQRLSVARAQRVLLGAATTLAEGTSKEGRRGRSA